MHTYAYTHAQTPINHRFSPIQRRHHAHTHTQYRGCANRAPHFFSANDERQHICSSTESSNLCRACRATKRPRKRKNVILSAIFKWWHYIYNIRIFVWKIHTQIQARILVIYMGFCCDVIYLRAGGMCYHFFICTLYSTDSTSKQRSGPFSTVQISCAHENVSTLSALYLSVSAD